MTGGVSAGDAVQTIRQFGDEREEQYFIQDKRLPELGTVLVWMPSRVQLGSRWLYHVPLTT